MKRIGLIILVIVLLAGVCACDGQEIADAGQAESSQGQTNVSEESVPPPSPEPEEYIWTITIDEEQNEVVDAEVGASMYSRLKLSMSKTGGETPFGVYRGEIDYSYEMDMGSILSAFLDAADTDGWGKNDSFEIELLPYDEIDFEAFEAGVAAVFETGDETGGEEGALSPSLAPLVSEQPEDTEEADTEPEPSGDPSLAPLQNYYAMYCGEDLVFTEEDFSTSVSMPEGLLDFQGDGDYASGSINLGPLGSYSDAGEVMMPYSIMLIRPAELEVQFTLYGNHNYVYRGTIDKVPLSDTIEVQE